MPTSFLSEFTCLEFCSIGGNKQPTPLKGSTAVQKLWECLCHGQSSQSELWPFMHCVYTIFSQDKEPGCGGSAVVDLLSCPFSPTSTSLKSVLQDSALVVFIHCPASCSPREATLFDSGRRFYSMSSSEHELLTFSFITLKMDPPNYSRKQTFFNITSDVFFRLVLT